MQKETKTEQLTVTAKIEQFIIRFRKQLIIVVSVLAAVLIIFTIVSVVTTRRTDAYTVRVEEAQELFNTYKAADEQNRAELAEQLTEELEEIIARNRRNYPELRAIYLSGQLAYQEGRHEDAAGFFGRAADQYSNTYLAAPALVNQAVALELAGKPEAAIESYQRLADRHKGTYQGIPRAMLNMGRLYESLDNVSAARSVYEQLSADYADTEWGKLAQSRLIQLDIGM